MNLRARAAQSIQCLIRNWKTGVQSPEEAENFSSTLCVQTSSEAHPASYSVSTGGPLQRGEARQQRDADRSLPSTAEVENE
jgi:hypothetical protein